MNRTSTLKMEDCGMKNWSHDIPPGEKQYFKRVLIEMKQRDKPRILEIGSFAGVSIMTMKEIVPDAECVCIDNWGLADGELQACMSVANDNTITMQKVRNTFMTNTKGQVKLIEKDSARALVQLQSEGEQFDFIYVDGSHRADDTLVDMCMAWSLLKKGGIIGIDDYLYVPPDNPNSRPGQAVDYFMQKLQGVYEVISIHYRVFLRKTV